MAQRKVSKAAESKKPGKVIFTAVAGDIQDIDKHIGVFTPDVNDFQVLR